MKLPIAFALLTAAMVTQTATAEVPQAPPAIGQTVSQLTFKDIRYLPRTLADLGEHKACVLLFTTLDCPLVQRYLPVVKQLDEELRGQGVQFLAINVGPNDPLTEVAYQAVRVGAEFPFVKDFDGAVARAVGATRTPEVVVLDGARKLRYRGRIDSQFRLGGVRPDAGRADLKLALEELLAGREISVLETPVDGCLIEFPKPRPPDAPVTFAERIAPLLQKYCQECHHEGRGPFPLLTYDDAVSHAATMAEVVREGRMPPWYASREHGEFINRRALSAAERKQVADWVRADCPLGDESKLPKPREFPKDAWRIGTPDLVITSPQTTRLPASGYIPYKYIILPHLFLADTWIQKAEIRPSNPRTVHHCNMAFVRPGDKFSEANFITGQVPGGDALDLDSGMAFKIPAFSLLALQVHYVSTGQEAEDQLSVGLCFPKETVQKQLRHVQVKNRTFEIPPGAPHHEVAASRTLNCDATGVGMFTHMHVRGKDMVFRAWYPEGRNEPLLAVPNYSFDWQMPYRWAPGAMKFPRGTRIECVAHYDNSPFNPYNPDPSATVREGQQTYEEMMYGFFFYTDDAEQLNLRVDPATGRLLESRL
jgi:thiol-disulfide isomerase/thioredoxin